MKTKILKILNQHYWSEIGSDEAYSALLNLHVVSNQRELLIAFKLYLHEEYGEQLVSGSIDEFIKHISD